MAEPCLKNECKMGKCVIKQINTNETYDVWK